MKKITKENFSGDTLAESGVNTTRGFEIMILSQLRTNAASESIIIIGHRFEGKYHLAKTIVLFLGEHYSKLILAIFINNIWNILEIGKYGLGLLLNYSKAFDGRFITIHYS